MSIGGTGYSGDLKVAASARISRSGPMALFPLQATADTKIERSTVSFDPPGIPRLMGTVGHIIDSGERIAYFSMELPIRVSPVTLQQQEIRDVASALRSGLRLIFEDDSITSGRSPNDPPDVILNYLGERWQIETAQVHMPGSGKGNEVSRWMEFARLLDRILVDAPRLKSKLRAHRGHVLYVGFGNRERPAIAAGPRVDYAEFLQFLAEHAPPKVELPVGVPNDAPTGHLVRSDDGRFNMTWVRGSTGSLLERMLGFDLGLMYATDVTESRLRGELRRIVDDHDHPVNDLVILALGMPTGSGWQFPSSSLLADLALNDPRLPDDITTNHLHNIALFDAGSNQLRWLKGKPPWASCSE